MTAALRVSESGNSPPEPVVTPQAGDAGDAGGDPRGGSANGVRGDGAAAKLVSLCVGAELFLTPAGEPYATVKIGDRVETLKVKGAGFKEWLQQGHFRMTGRAASDNALDEALGVLAGRARYDGRAHEVFIRVARVGDAIYIDLGDDLRRVVEVTAAGTRVLVTAPVKFRRTPQMRALPEPAVGGDLQALRQFVNVRNEDDFRLLVGFMLGALSAKGPFPLLEVHGEQGSAKQRCSR